MKIVQGIDESSVDELLDLVQSRDDAIESLQLADNISEVEREILAKIINYDVLIASRMNVLMEEAAQGLEKIAKTKVQKQSYEKMYAGESYFFDKKE